LKKYKLFIFEFKLNYLNYLYKEVKMNSIYKGLLLFVLIANALALPIKKVNSDGKMVVFEKIRTVLNCVCYYEEGQTLDKDKIEEYCDCTPEKVESDKSLVDESEVSNLKKANGKFIHGESDEDLDDVQKYGSADAAFFENLEENEAKEDQANEDNTIPLNTNEGKFITVIDDLNEDADVDGTVEDIPEFEDVQEQIISSDNKKYIVSNNADTVTETEDIYDEDGNIIHVQVDMVGEAYEEEDNGEDDDVNDDNVESRPTITRVDDNRKILNELDGPLTSADAKYIIDYYNDDEEIEMEEDDEPDNNDEDDAEGNEEEEEEHEFTEEVVKYRKGNEMNMVSLDDENADAAVDDNAEKNDEEDNEDDDGINEDDDVRTIYKKLIIKKLKNDIKNMDSEKLIVDIIKESLQGKGSKDNENPLKMILSN